MLGLFRQAVFVFFGASLVVGCASQQNDPETGSQAQSDQSLASEDQQSLSSQELEKPQELQERRGRPDWVARGDFETPSGRAFVGSGEGRTESQARDEAFVNALASVAQYVGAEVSSSVYQGVQETMSREGLSMDDIVQGSFSASNAETHIQNADTTFHVERQGRRYQAWAKADVPADRLEQAQDRADDRLQRRMDAIENAHEALERQRDWVQGRSEEPPERLVAVSSGEARGDVSEFTDLASAKRDLSTKAELRAKANITEQVHGVSSRVSQQMTDDGTSSRTRNLSTGRIYWEELSRNVTVSGNTVAVSVSMFGWGERQ